MCQDILNKEVKVWQKHFWCCRPTLQLGLAPLWWWGVGGGPEWRSSQQSESSHALNYFKTGHFPIHPPDSQAAGLPQAELQMKFAPNFLYHSSTSVPLRLPSTHNRRPLEQTSPWCRHLKGLCRTLALYPDQCVTLLVTEDKFTVILNWWYIAPPFVLCVSSNFWPFTKRLHFCVFSYHIIVATYKLV